MKEQIERHMQEEVQVGTPDGEDDYGGPTGYTPLRTIKVKRESKTVALSSSHSRGGQGVQFEQKDVFFTFEEVKKGDLLWFEGADTSQVSEAKRAQSVAEVTGLSSSNVTLYEVTIG